MSVRLRCSGDIRRVESDAKRLCCCISPDSKCGFPVVLVTMQACNWNRWASRAHEGTILCASKNDVVVEFSLKTKGNPIGVAPYAMTQKLPKELEGKLPTVEELREVLLGA